MSKHLQHFIKEYRPKLEDILFENLPLSRQYGTHRFNEALHYTIFPGGKRWRPILTLLGGMIVGATPQNVFPAACAIEYLHSSSMIIDDLPAMDDADIRRGKASLHMAYDESTAMLVSLGLMNQAYSLLALSGQNSGHSGTVARLITKATACIGADGMIGGQVVDLELRGNCFGKDILASRNLKTTALMCLMMTAGAIAANAYETEIIALSKFGEALGMAYQICDDLLDELGETRAIGKPLKQDERHQGPSYVSKYGIGEAQKIASQFIEDGNEILRAQFGIRPEVRLLSEAAELILAPFNMPLAQNKYEVVAVN